MIAAARKKLITANRGVVVVAASTALATAGIALAACHSGSHGTTAASTTSSGAAATSTAAAKPAPARDDQLALKMLDAIVQGNFDCVTTHFDSLMRQKLTSQALASAWSEAQQVLGNYQSHGDPEDVPRGDLTVVNVPLHMAQMPGQFRVTFHNDGTVAGLYFLRAGVPVP
ncbi:DUF3887 domain-containing protein [Mycobacterium sp.]|uniref:DUF3887 domain-containing protein n=1 Tax=Mycobacterium sp. TaxID=1785 RepID=UPI003C70CDDA